MRNTIIFLLFGAACLSLVLHMFLRRGKTFLAIFSELMTAAGLLTGLALGFSLENLAVPVVLLAGISLLPFLRKEGGDEL
ncbi:MAG: hypothetical protein IJ206_09805 [Oscillospiraceae bacterium]|nr:hypothetical protein [Oscillospiraceae bacterium]